MPRAANKDRDRDPGCSEAPPTPPGVPVRTGRFISLTIYRGVCRERFRCLRATHLRISLGLYDVSVYCLQSFRGSQLWRECVRVAKIQTRCLRITFAGFLPTVRRLPAVALALYFNSVETFGILPPSQFPFSYRGLVVLRTTAPHKFTPMLGVPMNRSGRRRRTWMVN